MEISATLQNLQTSIKALDDSTRNVNSVLLKMKRFNETDAVKLNRHRQAIAQRSVGRIERMDRETLNFINDLSK